MYLFWFPWPCCCSDSLVAVGGAAPQCRHAGLRCGGCCYRRAWAPGHRLRGCGARGWLPHGVGSSWTRDQAVSPTLAAGFVTTEPPGNPLCGLFVHCFVTQSRLTPCDPTDCSMPGFRVLQCLPEFAQTYVH